MLTRRFRIVLVFLLASLSPARASEPAPARTDRLRALLTELIESKDDGRAAIYDRIAQTSAFELIPALNAYDFGLLRLHEGQPVIYQPRVDVAGRGRLYPIVDALTLKPISAPGGGPLYAEKLGPTRKAPPLEHKTIKALVARFSLLNPDPQKQKEAIVTAGERAEDKARDLLQSWLDSHKWGALTYEARVAVARIDLAHGDRAAQLRAAQTLQQLAPIGPTDLLEAALKQARTEHDIELTGALVGALDSINRYQRYVDIVQETFAGLSLGSILIIMGLGLSIIFGLMRVINMAHGKFMMIGAFSAFVLCQFFKNHVPATYFNTYWLVAMPAAFLVAAIAGWVCEVTVIRWLYGRPLDSLLATWGISLILIQMVRVSFGDTTAITPPSWFGGGWEAFRGLVLPRNRLFIIGYCTACIGLVHLVVYRTHFGLMLRATQQNRAMASVLGVDTRKIDGLAFAFGTGLAGLAGCAVVLFDKLNPQMGQGYIVDSFMVVIMGGVGKLPGVVVAGGTLGFLTKYIEPWLHAIYGKLAVLFLVILFIQRWPAGLFADKGRLSDD